MKSKAFILIIAAGIFWGTSPLFVHLLAPYGLTSLQMTGIRGAVSFLCTAIFALIRDRSIFRVDLVQLAFCLGVGVAQFLTATFYYSAIQLASPSIAVVLMYSAPIYVTAYAAIFMGERLSVLKVTSVAIMLAGCCLVSGLIGDITVQLTGLIFALLSGLSYAVYNILLKYASGKGLRSLTITMYSFATITLLALCVADVGSIPTIVAKDPLRILVLLPLLGASTCAIPYVLYTRAMRDLSAGTATALGIIEPMAATIFSVLLLDERLTVFPVIGIVLILTAVVLLSRAENDHKETKVS